MLQRAFCVVRYAITYTTGHAGKILCKDIKVLSWNFRKVCNFVPSRWDVLPYFVFFSLTQHYVPARISCMLCYTITYSVGHSGKILRNGNKVLLWNFRKFFNFVVPSHMHVILYFVFFITVIMLYHANFI